MLIRLVKLAGVHASVVLLRAAAVGALHAVFSNVKENEGVHQPEQLGLGQALVDEGILRAGDGLDILGHVDADEAGVAVVERIGQVAGAGIDRHIIADACRERPQVGGRTEVTLPQFGAAGDMVVVVAAHDEGLVVQPGILEDGHHGVHLAGDHPIILEITAVKDEGGMEADHLVDGGGEVFRLVPGGAVPMRIPQGHEGKRIGGGCARRRSGRRFDHPEGSGKQTGGDEEGDFIHEMENRLILPI